MPNQTNPERKAEGKRRWMGAGLAVLLVAALTAHAALTGVLPGAGGPDASSATQSSSYEERSDLDTHLREIGLIADGAVSAMAEGSAEASSTAETEVEAATQAAGKAVADASAEAEGALGAAGSGLGQPPADYDIGDEVEPGSFSVPSYKTPKPEWSLLCEGCLEAQWEGDVVEYRVRAGINDSPTGNDDIDGGASVLADIWLTAKNEVNATLSTNNNVTIVNSALGTVTSDGENVTYMPKPDEEGAAGAEAHARALLDSSGNVMQRTLSGVQAKVELESRLYAEVYAEINETMEAAAEAEAEIDATAEKRVEAVFAESAEAEAEVDEKAEYQVKEIREAQLNAKAKVRAAAEERAQAILNASEEQSQNLEARAEQTLESAADAVASVRAQEQAALAAAYDAQNATGQDMSAEIRAIQKASAAAEAAIMGKAEQQAELLLKQSSAISAGAEARAEAVLSAAVEAEAEIDARAEVAVEATARAAAYAKAKVRAEAQAEADAHLRVAQNAKAIVQAEAKQHVRAVLEAAFSLHYRMEAEFDGSQGFAEMVSHDMDLAVTKDIDYVKEVQSDYDRQAAFDREGRAEHWENVTHELVAEKESVVDVAHEIDAFVEENAGVFVGTWQGLNALGEKFL